MIKKTKAEKALDMEIEKLYKKHCSNIQISMMDIPKVFEAARKARHEGKDMGEAIVNLHNLHVT